MQSKLTLSLDKQVIDHAKAFASKNGRSLSSIIENYLKLLTRKETQEEPLSPRLRKLRGSMKLPKGADYREILTEELAKKYNM